MFTALLLVGFLAAVALQGRDALIGEAVDTRVLVGVLIVNGLVAAVPARRDRRRGPARTPGQRHGR